MGSGADLGIKKLWGKLSKMLHSCNFLTPYLESPIYPRSIVSALITLSTTGVTGYRFAWKYLYS